ncbi:MAG: serine hydrolase [Paracoccaceae bacterium]
MTKIALAAPYADFVVDARTGQVLHQDNADTRLHPASLTKMMTLYIAFEAIERGEISLDSKVTISRHAASQPPSKLGLKAGQQIALRYLIRAAAVKSANDAATAIGEAIEGSEPAFAKRMNRTAKALGMTRTSFRNANGLSADGHLSTARDMTTLGRHIFFDYPQYYNLFSRRSADAGMATVNSTNRRFLDSYKGADGIKTGYTSLAGFNLVASAERGGKRVIATVFGGKSTATRNARVAELLDLGFGKAPRKAAIQKPNLPQYAPDNEVDEPASVAVSGIGTTAAGKTLRLTRAVSKSPRPLPRPDLTPGEAPIEEMLLAMQDDIDKALAEAQAAPAAAETAGTDAAPVVVADAAIPPTEPEAGAIEIAADKGASPSPVAAEDTAPVVAALEDAAPEITVAEADVTGIAPAQSLRPAASPLRLAAATPQPAPTPEPAPVVVVEAPAPEAVAEAIVTATADVLPPVATVDTGQTTTVLSGPRPEQVVLAAYSAPEPAIEPLETVTRVSTSGGREWAINIGRFDNRYNAERMLLQTALVEMSTLDEALRKVVNRKGGFDANFVGMTREMAELACRRLQARQTECTVVGP